MTERKVAGVRTYHMPAGGWGALKATAATIAEQMRVAEGSELLLRANKPDGFDCPGCAWPDKKYTSTFEFCENGAKAVTWEATQRRVDPAFFAQHTVTELLGWSDHALEDAGRLTHPMTYDAASDKFVPIEWDAAYARIAQVLQAQATPDAVEFYTSGRASNESSFLFNIFAREYGTNNLADCSNMCHEPTSVGLPKTIGIGKGTVSLDDFDQCELIICIGHNPGTNHPRMMGTLHDCSQRGVPIIVLNPLRERALERFADPQSPTEMATLTSTRIASSYYQVKVGGDAAALKGIMKALVERDAQHPGTLDRDFIAQHTHGFEEFRADLEATSWDELERHSGLSRDDMQAVAQAYAKSKATIISYGMGITQHSTGAHNVQQTAALLLLRGNIGKPGAGICPLRGHSNVQGNRSVGITELIDPVMFDNIEKTFGFRPPERPGHNAGNAMRAISDGRSKVLICLGGNFAIAMPDTERCAQGMRGLTLAVHLNTKLNRSHLLIGKEVIVLPVLGRTESDVQASGAQAITVEDSMSMVHASRGKLPPASVHLRSEPAIIAGMAQATLPHSRVPWLHLIEDYDRIRDLIERIYPDFHDYNARIRVPGGFRLTLAAAQRVWKTASGKAEFLIFPGLEEDPEFKDTLKLTTVRSHDQYNTTIYGMDDRYRGVFGRRDVLFMNEEDMQRLGLAHGDKVEINTALTGQTHRRLTLTAIRHDISAGSAAAYFPEANNLCPLDYQDPLSGIPCYKSVPVQIRKTA
ncbi:FdhF/YdeP family oxidoreductase [Bordetella avium]|uniref:Probable molybdopterin-containing oxidoreductase n=1 Tax=Bordetella avium (strain 197N) TaxID=360910 RepID=Q2KXB2_BORA1|nr:FdhF/YdeP family oxidoreductase [Bordetella avium]AZY49877.1 CbbBc protein [Bordetella avium]RIQ51912.1 CbbBc protein [Bordetella avium]RIQ69037.1 CbbBc protein [Bordetella avium]CAJ50120.1 probable molybdopterin-containing oxidoreductase [Bordetella avium 197N]